MARNTLDLSTLENWLWEAACKIRGPVDAPGFEEDYHQGLSKRSSNTSLGMDFAQFEADTMAADAVVRNLERR